MPAPNSFEYAVLRVVPRVERGERINAGVVLYCRSCEFLEAAIDLDRSRLLALAPDADVPLLESHLQGLARVCIGGPKAGPIGLLSQAERFRWVVAPRSTVIQPSSVHEGLCEDPRVALAQVMGTLGLSTGTRPG